MRGQSCQGILPVKRLIDLRIIFGTRGIGKERSSGFSLFLSRQSPESLPRILQALKKRHSRVSCTRICRLPLKASLIPAAFRPAVHYFLLRDRFRHREYGILMIPAFFHDVDHMVEYTLNLDQDIGILYRDIRRALLF